MMPLNNGIVYDKLGLKIQTGLQGTFNFPKVTGIPDKRTENRIEGRP